MRKPPAVLHLIFVTCAAVLSSPPSRANACSCVAVAINDSDPKAGARDVPLNLAPVVQGVFTPSSVTLEDEDGAAVEFTLNEGPWPGSCPGTWAELLPKAPFAPKTRYTIRVTPIHGDAGPTSLSFTTGTDVLPEVALAQPTGGLAEIVHEVPALGALCGSEEVFACVELDDSDPVELIVRKGDEILTRTDSFVIDDALFAFAQVPDCIEVRRRSRTGKRSKPLVMCGDALNVRPWRASDSDPETDWVHCKDGVIGTGVDATGADAAVPTDASTPEADAGTKVEPQTGRSVKSAEASCAVAAGSPSGSNALVWLSTLLLVWRRGRRLHH